VKRILVPLDGSTLAEAILPLAEALARDHEASLLLVRALPSLGSAEAEVRAQEEAEAYLGGIAAGVTARGLSVEWKVWYEAPDQAIADATRCEGADLVAMSTHGRGGVSRLLFGSVAESLVRKGPGPVLLVRGEIAWRPGGLGTILVPLDGSELSEAVLPVVARLAGPFDLTIELFTVVEPMPGYAAAEVPVARVEEIDRVARDEAERYLSKVAAPLTARGLRVAWTVGRGHAVDAVLRHAQDAGVGLIAMSTHGRSGVGRLLLGSVAERVLRGAPVPVLLWKAPGH
jgi:nucleotide-binding universal stress UspA family protein